MLVQPLIPSEEKQSLATHLSKWLLDLSPFMVDLSHKRPHEFRPAPRHRLALLRPHHPFELEQLIVEMIERSAWSWRRPRGRNGKWGRRGMVGRNRSGIGGTAQDPCHGKVSSGRGKATSD